MKKKGTNRHKKLTKGKKVYIQRNNDDNSLVIPSLSRFNLLFYLRRNHDKKNSRM